jgi:hypothetical protein
MQNKMLLLLSAMLALSATAIADMAPLHPVSDDLSHNNSSISFVGQNEIISAPVNLSMGSGYYSSHPIDIGLGIGSMTELADASSATSMSHEIAFAQEVTGKAEYAVSSSSIRGDYESINSATAHMQIDENVKDGRLHIGVLSGMDNAWKNPAIEIDEEYVGTYHITKNFAINNSHSKKSFADGWLGCCGRSYITYPAETRLLSADDVFNCKRF